MTSIDYYFAPTSSYSYLAGTRLEDIARRRKAAICYRPLNISGLFAKTGGLRPRDRHPARQEYRIQELNRQAKKANLAINLSPAHSSSDEQLASCAIIAAQKAQQGNVGQLVHSLLRAVWSEEHDISNPAVVKDCMDRAGCDPELVATCVQDHATEYENNLTEAVNAGVFGAPFYIVTEFDERFWGQDRLDDLDRYLAGQS